MRRALLFLGTVLTTVPFLAAQEAPKVEIFGGYSYLNVDTEGLTDRLNFNGFDSNVTLNLSRNLGIEGDFAGHFQGNCADLNASANQALQDSGIAIDTNIRCRDFAYMVGPKVSFRTRRLTPFAHALFGGDSFAVSASAPDFSASVSQTRWSMAAGGGVDFSLSPRVSVRAAQFDYFLTNHSGFFGGTHQNHFRVSGGIVFKFGKSGDASSQHASATQSRSFQRTTEPTSFSELGLTARYVVNESGIELTQVIPDGPAGKAGMVRQDVIVSANGKVIESVEDLRAALSASTNNRVSIRYMYLGTLQYRTVELQF
jgi:opacity protein-like surface antigen